MPGPIAILYATVSGNAEALAARAGEQLQAAGREVMIRNVADFPAGRLQEFDVALIIASTWGEGAPPPDAGPFCAALAGPERRAWPHLRYAVFALGSANYRNFCGCGRDIDENLARGGAVRLLPRVESGTKFKAAFAGWLARVEAAL